MSSFNILGFFQLKSGRRASTQKPNSTYLTWYALYNTHVWCATNTSVPTEIRVYTPSTTPLLPDGTVIFATCTAQSSQGQNRNITLEILNFSVLPGDPSGADYDVKFLFRSMMNSDIDM